MIIVLLYLLLAVGAAIYARNLGRSLLGYFLLALVTTPFLAFVVLLLLGRNPDAAG